MPASSEQVAAGLLQPTMSKRMRKPYRVLVAPIEELRFLLEYDVAGQLERRVRRSAPLDADACVERMQAEKREISLGTDFDRTGLLARRTIETQRSNRTRDVE